MFRTRWLVFFALLSSIGCTNSSAKPTPAAEKPKVESELAFTNLSKTAYLKLDIKSEKLSLEEQQERLALTGWIMARPGHEVTLTAPTAGYVHFKNRRQAPVAGASIKEKDELLELEPVLTQVERIQVAALQRSIQSDEIKAKTTLTTAQSDFVRIEKLHKQNLKSDQELELAKKAVDHAREELQAAEEKLTFFKTQSIPLHAPQDGTILTLHVGPGQYVPTSAPLITIIDLDPVWVRVPVPEFEWAKVDQAAKIEIKNPQHDGKKEPLFLSARPVGRVAQIDPVKHTADLWYQLDGVDSRRYAKDQMISVKIPVGKKEKAPVVPYSAVVFDSHGHAWIYLERAQKNDKHQFERRPIELVTAVDNGLMIRSNLKDGDLVVTKGAAILFSRDFFKTPIAEDE